MAKFWLQGVVKNGQVVLETPLDLPDGTVVAISEYDLDEQADPSESHDPEQARKSLFASIGHPELADDPDWRAKLEKSREYASNDARPTTTKLRMTDEDFAELTAFLTKKRDPKEWPAFEAKLIAKYGDAWKPRPSLAG